MAVGLGGTETSANTLWHGALVFDVESVIWDASISTHSGLEL